MTTRVSSVLFLGAILLAGCGDRAPEKPALRILCGASMAQPVQQVGDAFCKAQGLEPSYDLGDSATVTPKVLGGAPGDILVVHEPFDRKVRDAGLMTEKVTVAGLRPVLLVRPGNPRQITALADLARPGLRLGMGQLEFSTCTQMFVEQLERRGLKDAVMKNVELQGRSHAETVNGLTVGPLDAVVAWNFNVPLYKGKVQVVPTPEADYPDVPITIIGLKNAPNPTARDAFLRHCRGEGVRKVFLEHGYDALKSASH